MTDPIHKTITVNCTAKEAFDVFVRETTNWWPLGSHAVSVGAGKVAQSVTIEPRVGGAVYEIMHDGTRSEWGAVQTFEAGKGFSMTWHPGSNADAPTLVAVEFSDLADGRAQISLTHSGWEAWAERASEMRNNYNNGWDHVLGDCFRKEAAKAAA